MFYVYLAILVLCHLSSCIGLNVETSRTKVNFNTPLGDLVGTNILFNNTRIVSEFLGVPYAQPPTEELRLKNPVPHPGWQGERDATSYKPSCTQFKQLKTDVVLPESEDCLYLNIFAPNVIKVNTPSSRIFPVLVWFHGTDYNSGSASLYPGQKLALKNVVVVTVNYRLGPFGFLYIGDEEMKGNFGIQDQILALKWVRDNIAAFRGNPEQVTVFGSINSVALLSLIPSAKGLFKGAISHSATVDHHLTSATKAEKMAAKLLNYLECEEEETIQCLQQSSLDEFLSFGTSNESNARPTWKAVVDGVLIPNDPYEMLESGEFAPVPYMAGFAIDGIGPTELQNMKEDNETDVQLYFQNIPKNIRDNFDGNEALREAVVFEYVDWSDPQNPEALAAASHKLATDVKYLQPILEELSLHSLYVPSTYLYIFEYKSRNTLKPDMALNHEMDSYVFGVPLYGSNIFGGFTDEDFLFSNFVQDLWISFALYGEPTRDTIQGIKWQHFERDEQQYLKLSYPAQPMKGYRRRKFEFWNNYLPKLEEITSKSTVQKSTCEWLQWVFLALVTLLFFLFGTIVAAYCIRSQEFSKYRQDAEHKLLVYENAGRL